MINFQWDENKRHLNLIKHGLDFEDAKEIFTDDAFFIEDNRKDYGEKRYILFGLLHKRVVIVVFTKCEKDTVRIISIRKANKREQKSYAKKQSEKN